MSTFSLYLRRSDDIEDVLSRISIGQRLPISLPVLQMLINRRIEEEELVKIGCEILTFPDGTKFLVSIPTTCLRFSPSLASLEQVRDTVVSLLSFRPERTSLKEPEKVCDRIISDSCECKNRHFVPIIKQGVTDINSGLCSYQDLCKNDSCKFIHVKSPSSRYGEEAPPEEPVEPPGPYGVEAPPEELVEPPSRYGEPPPPPTGVPEESSWIKCDIRTLDFRGVFSDLNVSAVLIDPPWDIHMELSYGTLTDSEMRSLDVGSIHDNGFAFLWATSRTVELARDCLRLWGYMRADEIIWVKTNQVGGIVRSGRTGHWLNHSKEHCLVGIKGDVGWSNVGKYRQDCDVIVSPVRENSRKPDEVYDIIERIVGRDRLCVELFGRNHNRRNGWLTLGNQLDDTRIFHPELARRFSEYR
jgi:mRNA (2'-O-methyladenosine-N6-)-methyltransferase